MTIRSWLPALLSGLLLLLASNAIAAGYPEASVHIIVGQAAGGSNDLVARLVGAKLSAKWSQPVLVENLPGADSTIALARVARAAPDGLTLALFPDNAAIPKDYKVNYDIATSFAPVTLLVLKPSILVVHPDVPAKNLKEFIALAKANPKKYAYGEAGTDTVNAKVMELLMKRSGIELLDVGYTGAALYITALLGNEIHAAFSVIAPVLQLVKDGKLRALAVSTASRSNEVPDVPTIAEAAGLPGFDVGGWGGIAAPAGTPAMVINKLHDDIVDVMAQPDLKQALTAQGFTVITNTPAEFAKKIASETSMWTDLKASAKAK